MNGRAQLCSLEETFLFKVKVNLNSKAYFFVITL